MKILNLLKFRKKEVIPEVLQAILWKLPDKLEVEIKRSESGGFYAEIKNLPGCITQADSVQELYEMINDAVITYFKIPPQYIPFIGPYIPSEEIRKELGIKIKEGELIFQKA